MAIFKEVVEPASIVLLFTIGSLINRRRTRLHRQYNDCETVLSPSSATNIKHSLEDPVQTRSNPLTRLLDSFPFFIEIWYWLLTYWVYQLARAASAHFIRGNDLVMEEARQHALQVLALEQMIGIDFEINFQKAILKQVPWLMSIFRMIYQLHIVVGVAFIVYSYTFFSVPIFQRVRRTIAMDNLLAFMILTSWRCMPPRLLPDEYGYIDILHTGFQTAWSHNRWQLTIAAMPSLHFGTAAFIGFCLWKFAPRSHVSHRILRYTATVYPFAMLLTILATANHFLFDAVVGVLVPVVGWRLQESLLLLRPLEEKSFRALNMNLPRPNEAEQ